VRPQTLAQAVYLVRTGRSRSLIRGLGQLVGCPEGGWAETSQGWSRLHDELPRRDEREYTADQLVEACLRLDHADRYRWRDEMLAVQS
jgi:hypothetical protein